MNAKDKGNNPTPTDPTHRIRIMMNLFKGRTDTFGLYAGGPGVPPLRAKSPVTEKDYRLHIKGDKYHRIGIYPDVNGYVKWAMIDVDEKDRETGIVDWAKAKAAVNAIVFYLKENGLHPHVEISKSKGYHIWVFFDEPILAGVVRSILQDIIRKAGEKDREIFPKQSVTGDGFGNFAALPLHGGSVNEGLTVFLNPDFTPITDQWSYLETPALTRAFDLHELYRSFKEEPEPQDREIPPSPMFDVANYLGEHKIQFTIKSETQKTIFQLPKCFWADRHTTADNHGDSAIIQDTEGLITYHCFHEHCRGRMWRDVRGHLAEKSAGTGDEQDRDLRIPVKFCDVSFTPREHIAKGFPLDRKLLYVNSADGGLLKSFMGLHLSKSFLTGRPLFHKYEILLPGAVLLFDEETPEPIMEERLNGFGLKNKNFEGYLFHFSGLRIDKKDDLRTIQGAVEKYHPVLVIFDSLTRFHNKEENSNSEMKEVMMEFRKVTNMGPMGWLIHHVAKDSKLTRGAAEIVNAADIEFRNSVDKEGLLTLGTGKVRVERPDPIIIKAVFTPGDFDMVYQMTGNEQLWDQVSGVLGVAGGNMVTIQFIVEELEKQKVKASNKKVWEILEGQIKLSLVEKEPRRVATLDKNGREVNRDVAHYGLVE